MKVSVLIPAFNEENNISSTVTALLRTNKVHEIIVADDGSTDNTAALAKKAGATVVKLPKNQGKGAALNVGAKYVTGDIVCLIDGDVGETAEEIEKLIEPIINKQSHMTIGKFPKKRKKGGFGLVKKIATTGIKSYTGKTFVEPLSGQRAFTKEVFQQMQPFANGFGVEVLLTIKAIKIGYHVIEVETSMSHSETGRNIAGFWHRGRQFLHVLRALMMVRGLKYD